MRVCGLTAHTHNDCQRITSIKPSAFLFRNFLHINWNEMTYKNQKYCNIRLRAVSACAAEIASVLISGHGSYDSAENIFIIEWMQFRWRRRRVFQSETAHRTRPLPFSFPFFFWVYFSGETQWDSDCAIRIRLWRISFFLYTINIYILRSLHFIQYFREMFSSRPISVLFLFHLFGERTRDYHIWRKSGGAAFASSPLLLLYNNNNT